MNRLLLSPMPYIRVRLLLERTYASARRRCGIARDAHQVERLEQACAVVGLLKEGVAAGLERRGPDDRVLVRRDEDDRRPAAFGRELALHLGTGHAAELDV